ncbi:GNAT family N-acetyltransferase, partial [Planomicrobium chinense]|uniref:GNAT family N-acetyltransferase n=1 Tax=Planococcus chinensis TaxID=272917 RepID=UPI001CC663BE
MWTDPAYRGRGLGGVVLEMVVEDARRRGLVPHLFVMQDNPSAARLYERHGFVRSGLVEEHGGRLAEQLVREV